MTENGRRGRKTSIMSHRGDVLGDEQRIGERDGVNLEERKGYT